MQKGGLSMNNPENKESNIKNKTKKAFFKPEEATTVIDNFINLKMSEMKALSGSHKQDFKFIYECIDCFFTPEEEIDNLTLLDIFSMTDKLKNDDPHAPSYTYELIDFTDDDGTDFFVGADGTDLYIQFLSDFLSVIMYHRGRTPTPQSLPMRLFCEISIADLENYMLAKSASDPNRNEEDINRVLHRIEFLAQNYYNGIRCKAEDPCAYRACRLSTVLSALDMMRKSFWIPYGGEESIDSYRQIILNAYSDIYALLVEPFKAAFPSYFETHYNI